jgi:K+-sensing histidine kinase KdpD
MWSEFRAFFRPRSLLTTALSAAIAFAMCLLCRDHAVKAAVPVTFLLALIPAVLIGGRMASLAVAILSSFIFAVWLFEPYGSLAVHDAVDQLELVCFGVAAIGVVHFSPGPDRLAGDPTLKRSSTLLLPSFNKLATWRASEPLETWIAVVGYAVVLTAIVTLLLNLWNSMRYPGA